MTDSYRVSTNKAKAVRAGIVDQRATGGRNKAPRPIVVETRWKPAVCPAAFKRWAEWSKHRAYRNVAEAQALIDLKARTEPNFEYRIKP